MMLYGAKTDCDVAIVGAGPAGSSLAVRLAEAGLRVILIERSQFPREKLCGEFISPDCLAYFHDLGLDVNAALSYGSRIHTTRFYALSGRSLSIDNDRMDSNPTQALGLSRAEMDRLLLTRAVECGAQADQATTVTGFEQLPGVGVRLLIKDGNGKRRQITAALAVDATGRRRALASKLPSRDTQRTAAGHVAFKTHVRGAHIESGSCEIYVFKGGYGGCNAVEDDLFNICFIARASDARRCGSDAERIMRTVVFENKRAATSLADIEAVKPWLAVPIDRFGRGDLVPGDRILSVGDAAAFIDPFTGSGILMALQSSQLAAEAILSQSGSGFAEIADTYTADYAALFNSRLRFCSIMRRAAFAPGLAEAVIMAVGSSSILSRTAARATRSGFLS